MCTPLTHVVFVVPPTVHESPGLQRALALCRSTGATLHLLLTCYDDLIDAACGARKLDVGDRAKRDFLRERGQRLRHFAAQLPASDFRIETETVWAVHVHEAVEVKALAVGAQLIVKDVERASLLRRLTLQPGDSKLVRLAPCDVLLTRAGRAVRRGKIMVGIDVFAEERQAANSLNDFIVRRALYVAEALDSSIDVVSSYWLAPPSTAGAFDAGALYAEMDADHRDLFSAFVTRHRIPIDRAHRLSGAPAPTLVSYAQKHAVDLVVVGSVYRNALDRFLLGSTSEVLLHELDCDVWVVKPASIRDTLGRLTDLDALQARFLAEQPMAMDNG